MSNLINALQTLTAKDHRKVLEEISQYQLSVLFKNGFIDPNDANFIKDEIISSAKNMKDNRSPRSIPFIICPQKINIESLYMAINLGNKDDNSFFLDESSIFDHKAILPGSEYILTTNVQTNLKFFDGSKGQLIKLPHAVDEILTFPEEKKLTLREVICLLLYYPEIFNHWDAVFAGGSYWQHQEGIPHSLRIYRLNNFGPHCYAKLAREKARIVDSRFLDPRCLDRIII